MASLHREDHEARIERLNAGQPATFANVVCFVRRSSGAYRKGLSECLSRTPVKVEGVTAFCHPPEGISKQ